MNDIYRISTDAYGSTLPWGEPGWEHEDRYVRAEDLADAEIYANLVGAITFPGYKLTIVVEPLAPTHFQVNYFDLASERDYTLRPMAFEDSRLA